MYPWLIHSNRAPRRWFSFWNCAHMQMEAGPQPALSCWSRPTCFVRLLSLTHAKANQEQMTTSQVRKHPKIGCVRPSVTGSELSNLAKLLLAKWVNKPRLSLRCCFHFCNDVLLLFISRSLSSLHQWAVKLTAGRQSLPLGPIRRHSWMRSFWPLAHRWPGCWSWLWSSRGRESPSCSLICSTIKPWQVTSAVLSFRFESTTRFLVTFQVKLCSPFTCIFTLFCDVLSFLYASFHPFIHTSCTHPHFIQTFSNRHFWSRLQKWTPGHEGHHFQPLVMSEDTPTASRRVTLVVWHVRMCWKWPTVFKHESTGVIITAEYVLRSHHSCVWLTHRMSFEGALTSWVRMLQRHRHRLYWVILITTY